MQILMINVMSDFLSSHFGLSRCVTVDITSVKLHILTLAKLVMHQSVNHLLFIASCWKHFYALGLDEEPSRLPQYYIRFMFTPQR